MAFLMPGHGGGYPAEYLLARLGGRRSALISDWEPLLAASDPLAVVPTSHLHGTLAERGDEEVWGGFLRESSWLFSQMNSRLRRIFAPVFSWFEIRTVTLALRFGAGDEAGRVERLLAPSLLAAEMKRLLVSESDPQRKAESLARLLAGDDPRYRDVGPAYRAGGVQGAEETLVTIFLEQATAQKGHPAITDFFRSLVDTLNILYLRKRLRWHPARAPRFLTGGRVSTRELTALLRSGEAGDPATLVRLAGEEIAMDGGIEPRLLTWLYRRLRRLGRNPDGVGVILEYLWRCYLETRNLSLLVHAPGRDRERIREELVR